MVERLVDHRPLALAPRTTARRASTRPRVQPAPTAAAFVAARTMVIASTARLLPALASRGTSCPRLALRFIARITRLTAILVVRTPARRVARPTLATSLFPRLTAVRRSMRLRGRMRNRFGGLGLGRLFGAGRRNRIAQLRKDFLQHEQMVKLRILGETPAFATSEIFPLSRLRRHAQS
jgi:hypothetical protein